MDSIHASPSFYREIDQDVIQTYFKNFETLSKLEKWEDIILQGRLALEEARTQKKFPEEAKICAQLTSTSFYHGYVKKSELIKAIASKTATPWKS